MKTFRLTFLVAAIALGSLGAKAQKMPLKNNPNEGTLVGALQDLFAKKPALRQGTFRTITGKISMDGYLERPYVMGQDTRVFAFVNDQGYFSMNVPSEETNLIVGAAGIEERFFPLSEEHHYEVKLMVEHDPGATEHLYGMSLDRRSYNGAYTTVSAEEIRSRAGVSMGTILEGTVPGLSVTGVENGVRSQLNLRIRGRGSILSSNEPLILVDGTPYSAPLHTINPFDVASATVLKDGIGKSVYGMRGGNGVIMINTKRGGNIRLSQ